MKGIVVCICLIIAILFVVVAVKIKRKLDVGERDLIDGAAKLRKYDNCFFNFFASDKLNDGRKRLAEDRKMFSFGKVALRVCVVLACVAVLVAVFLAIR